MLQNLHTKITYTFFLSFFFIPISGIFENSRLVIMGTVCSLYFLYLTYRSSLQKENRLSRLSVVQLFNLFLNFNNAQFLTVPDVIWHV